MKMAKNTGISTDSLEQPLLEKTHSSQTINRAPPPFHFSFDQYRRFSLKDPLLDGVEQGYSYFEYEYKLMSLVNEKWYFY